MKNVVILGAGFAGVSVAKTLASAVRDGSCKVTVVDRNAAHVFTPLLYEAATGFVEHSNLGTAALLNAGVTVGAADMFRKWGADFRNAAVEGADWEKKLVLLRGEEPIPFDYLVIALGAEVNFFGITGLQENAFTLKSVRDADRLRQRVHDLLHMREKGTAKRMEIVIGGGGATGVELAAELTMFLRRHMVKGHLKPSDFNISVVEASPRLLGSLPAELSAVALERLHALGVHVYLDSAVKEAGLDRVVLVPRACKPGEDPSTLVCDFRAAGEKVIDTDIVVWAGGVRGSMTLEHLGLPLDPRGHRLEVGSDFSVKEKTDVFALGDSAVLIDPATKRPAPWLAQAAELQGKILGRTIASRLHGKPDSVYEFPKYPVVVPLGGKYAIAFVGNMKFIGFWGWILKELANLRYFLSILPFGAALGKWWNGAVVYARND
jgi:NADH dehydrogenase